MTNGLPRVLLVDDDAAIRRLVGLVLEEEALQLICCASAEEALVCLAAAPVDLLITDLMMPGLSGFDLLARLQAEPGLRGQAQLFAFSAGLSPERAERLRTLGVERLLDKPVAVAVLLDAVRQALAALPTAAVTAVPAPAAELAVPPAFGGDRGLYTAFLDICLQQYRTDLAAGDAAVQGGDSAALRRIAHNLKGSLRMLGEEALADLALDLEQACANPLVAGGARQQAWADLASGLRAFAKKRTQI